MKKNRLLNAMKISPRAQSMLEFALALPILLLLLFGIIEFGRLMQAWLALQNGARFGVRYALTGSFNGPAYCAMAGDALGLKANDAADGNIDCRVNKEYSPINFEQETQALEDWARLPSIRDAAIAGATGVAWNPEAAISGNYLSYLSDNDLSAFSDDFRGNPSEPDYFNVTTCSSRRNTDGSYFQLDYNKRYYGGNNGNDLYTFPPYCELATTSNIMAYFDDAGGPGDRVKVILTYRHQLITPFLSSWWPTLRLSSEREGLVEKFRQARVTGLTGSNPIANTWTYTPLPPTPTMTPFPCDGNNIQRMVWTGVTTRVADIYSLPGFPGAPTINSLLPEWEVLQSSPDRNNFGERISGMLCVPYDGDYQFRMKSDDHSKLYIDTYGIGPEGKVEVLSKDNNWTTYTTSGNINLRANTQYYIEVLHREGTGSDNITLQWKGPGVYGGTGTTKTPGTDDFVTLLDDYVYSPPADATNPPDTCNGSGILAEYWSNISGSSVNDLRNNIPDFPNGPDGSVINNIYEFPVASTAWANNYGARVHGYLCAPVTGYYTFALSSDEKGELWLSTNTNPANNRLIAYTTTSTGFRVYSGQASQRSIPLFLEANTKYYIEALYKESTGSDYVSVAWSVPNMAPDQVILQRFIEPATPAPTFQSNCEDVVLVGAEPLKVLGNRIEISIANNNRVYPMQITSVSGTWLNAWHDEIAPQNPKPKLTQMEVRSTSQYNSPTAIAVPAGQQQTLNTPQKSWTVKSSPPLPIVSFFKGIVDFLFTPNLSTNTYAAPNKPTQTFQYYHGNDFETTIYYWIQDPNRLCTLDATGGDGPDVDPVLRTTQIAGGKGISKGYISIAAAVTAPRNVNKVYFTVFRSDGTMVGYYEKTTSNARLNNGQYCMFGKLNNTTCNSKQVESDYWEGVGPAANAELIKSSETYTIYIIVEDAGAPKYSARDGLTLRPIGGPTATIGPRFTPITPVTKTTTVPVTKTTTVPVTKTTTVAPVTKTTTVPPVTTTVPVPTTVVPTMPPIAGD